MGRNQIVSTRFNAIKMLGFNYTVGFPETVTVLSSSLIVARNPEGYSKPAPEETEESSSPTAGQFNLHEQAQTTRSLEPILFPKLRIYFADFPYSLYPIDQRLLILATGCG